MDKNEIKYFGITEQQFGILRAIDSAASSGVVTPKAIEETYKRISGKPIQKPNLFTQLRVLENRSIVTKINGAYCINKSGLKRSILSQKDRIVKEIELCDTTIKDLDNIFKAKLDKFIIKYFDKDNFYKASEEELRHATAYYRCSNLPSVTNPDASSIYIKSAKDYSYLLLNACRKGTLKVNYITSLDPNKLFLRVFEKTRDKKIAYAAIVAAYANMIKLIGMPNMQFHYSYAQLESFGLIESSVANSMWLPSRISGHSLMGGVLIENETLYNIYKTTFDNLWANTKPLTKALIKKVAAEKLKELRHEMNYLIKNMPANNADKY